MSLSKNSLNLLPDATLISSLALAFIATKFWPLATFNSLYIEVAGWLLVVAGIACGLHTLSVIRSKNVTSNVADTPPGLITDGMYAISRNPFYLSYVVITIGAACVLGSLAAFIGPIVCIAVLQFVVIPVEEKALQASQRQKYTQYKQRVRRWL